MTQATRTIEKYIIELQHAEEFYAQSPDGQYDLFASHLISREIAKMQYLLDQLATDFCCAINVDAIALAVSKSKQFWRHTI